MTKSPVFARKLKVSSQCKTQKKKRKRKKTQINNCPFGPFCELLSDPADIFPSTTMSSSTLLLPSRALLNSVCSTWQEDFLLEVLKIWGLFSSQNPRNKKLAMTFHASLKHFLLKVKQTKRGNACTVLCYSCSLIAVSLFLGPGKHFENGL